MSNFLDNFDSEPKQTSVKTEKTLPKRKSQEEETEIDPKFARRKKQKYQLIAVLSAAFLLIASLVYYQLTRVTMPDFKNKPFAEAQTWAAKNKMTIEPKYVFDLKIKKNGVSQQSVQAGKQVKKGSKITLTMSQGGDPEEKLTLPDFSKLELSAAEAWLKENQVENLAILSEYDEKIPSNQFLRLEFAGDVTKESFKRSDNGNLYYSKGKEVFQKNIAVPNFIGKPKTDVETWAKKNDLELNIKNVASDTLPVGEVVKQTIAEKEKIAKKTKFEVEVSAGKGTIVPDFSTLTKESAVSQGDLQVKVSERFNPDVPYGELLSQSVAAGTELTSEDDLTVEVVYSAGKPYMKDLTGELEGELQRIFYEDFRSKGANIYYVVNYVASEEKKGTIVSMSPFNTFLPLEYTVTVNVSNGP